MQEELRKKNVIVTRWPLKEKISFDEEFLRKVAGTQSQKISINSNIYIINYCCDHSLDVLCAYFADYSIKPPGNGCLPMVVSGFVWDMWCTLPSPTDSMWTPYGKDHNLQFCIKSIWTPSGLHMESRWNPSGIQVDSSTCIITKKYQYFSLLHLFLLES